MFCISTRSCIFAINLPLLFPFFSLSLSHSLSLSLSLSIYLSISLSISINLSLYLSLSLAPHKRMSAIVFLTFLPISFSHPPFFFFFFFFLSFLFGSGLLLLVSSLPFCLPFTFTSLKSPFKLSSNSPANARCSPADACVASRATAAATPVQNCWVTTASYQWEISAIKI